MTDPSRKRDGRGDRGAAAPGQGSRPASRPTPRPAAPEVKDRRRAIQRAIRQREDPPPGLEEVAMQVALRQSGLRWFVVLYAFGFLLEVLGVVVADSAGVRIRDAVLALLFLGLGWYQWRTGQLARQAVNRWSATYPDAPSAQPVRPRSRPQTPDPDSDPDQPDDA